MNRIKVAHITTVDLSLRYLLLEQLCDLKRVGYEVSGISSPGLEISTIEAAGIDHIPVLMTRRAFTPWADLTALWRLFRAMRRERFTIVHTHTPKAGILGRCAARIARTPVIIHTNHGFLFHEGSSKLGHYILVALEKIGARCCDLIFSVNEEDIQTALREGICDAGKIVLLGKGGCGVDLARFDPGRFSQEDIMRKRVEIGLPINVRVIGFVGRLVREKGLLELFEAVRRVREVVPGIRLLIIGPSDEEKPDALGYEVVKDFHIGDICQFLGLRQDMAELYALMDVLVLPSHREGFGLVLAEAAASGVPVIATDIRGCREAVAPDCSGLLVPLGDVQALTNGIVEILTDRNKADRMAKEGRRIAIERFDQRLVFEKVKTEYARLLREKGLTAPQVSSVVQSTMA